MFAADLKCHEMFYVFANSRQAEMMAIVTLEMNNTSQTGYLSHYPPIYFITTLTSCEVSGMSSFLLNFSALFHSIIDFLAQLGVFCLLEKWVSFFNQITYVFSPMVVVLRDNSRRTRPHPPGVLGG